jgi:choice-of-anchor B domain-containing protein
MKHLSIVFVALLLSAACFAQSPQSLNMSLLANWDDPSLPAAGSNRYNDCWGYSDCYGNEYAILGSSAFVHFFDITDPENPQEIAAFAGGNTTTWRDMKTYRDHAYSVCDACQEGLMVYNLSNLPNTVELALQTVDFFGPCHNIYIDEQHGRMYAAGSSGAFDGVVILDLTQDPGNPQLMANASLPGGYVHDIFVRDHIGYASHGNNGLWVYDFTDPENPIVLGTLINYPESGYNHSSWLSDDGNTLIMADETHNRSVKSVNVSELNNIQVIDLFRSTLLAPDDTASIVHNPFIRGNYVFLSYYHDGLQVFDMTDPTNVVQVAYYDTEPNNTTYSGFTGCWGTYPFLPSGVIIASDMKNGLFLLRADSLELAPTEINGAYFDLSDLSAEAIGPCTGDPVQLSVNPGADAYQWFNNGSPLSTDGTASVTVNTSGCFRVLAQAGTCQISSGDICIEQAPGPDINISALPYANVCQGDTVLLQLSTNADSFSWFLNGALLEDFQELNLEVTNGGSYQVQGLLEGCSSTSAISVNFQPAPVPEIEVTSNGNLRSVLTGVFYQWYLNGEPIPGANNRFLTPSDEGDYQVEVTYSNDCSNISEPFTFLLPVNTQELTGLGKGLLAIPNPSPGMVQVSWAGNAWQQFVLFDVQGKLLQSWQLAEGQQELNLDLSPLPSGIYVLRASGVSSVESLRLIRP